MQMRNLRATLVTAMLAAAIVIGVQQIGRYANAVQNELVPPTAGVYTGVQFSQLIGDAFRSVASCNKGPTAPANVGGSAVDGLCWIDDSVSPWIKKRYADGAWVVEGAIDDANGLWVGVLGGGTATVASASTTDLGSVPQANITISGTATITAFGSSAPTGISKIIRFSDTLQLTHSSNLKVPGGYPLSTAADDRAIVTHLGSGAWEITQYTRASGLPIDVAEVGKVSYAFSDLPANYILGAGQALTRTQYPAYLAKVTRAQNGTRASGNATITSVSDTSGLGAGMPVEGTGIQAGSVIVSVTSSTIVLDKTASSSGTSTVTVFKTGYGNGGDATTVGVPDCRGRFIAGRDPTGSLITSAGSGIVGDRITATGGAQNVTIGQVNLPNVTLTTNISDPGHAHSMSAPTVNDTVNPSPSTRNVASTVSSTATSSATTGITASTPLGGSGTAVNKMPPTMIADCIVRLIP